MDEPQDDERVEFAARVADGEPVDWGRAAASARSDEERKFFERLRAVAEIAKAQPGLAPADAHDSIRAGRAGPGSTAGDPITWGPLRIIAKIGRGSFGDVYRAYDPRLDREVALKLLRERPGGGPQSEIVQEARLMARVRHPNVVTIYGAERIDGRTGIWMELLSERNLAEEVKAQGPLEPLTAARTTADIASALSAIHGAGLLHRDVKPQNVLRSERGLAVLTDFGTGQDVGGAASPVAGTPLYVAPEILRGEAPSTRSDIYSLGVLLYFLLTGRYPVEAHSLDDVRAAHREGLRVPVRSRRHVPHWLTVIVERALAAEQSARFGSAADFERALRAQLERGPARALSALALLALLVLAAAFSAWRANPVRNLDTRALVRAAASIPPGMRLGGVAPDGSSVICSGPRNPLGLCHLESDAVKPLSIDPSGGVPDGAFAAFSPDGRRIVYMRRMDGSTPVTPMALHIVNADGTGDRRIFEPRGEQWFLRPTAWPARANVIVADLMHFDQSHRIVLVDPESGAMRLVREFDSSHPVQTMAVSADGRYIVHDFQQGPSWTRDLVVVDTQTTNSWTLVGSAADDLAPAWSADGSLLFFTSDRSGTMGIWVQRVVDARPVGEPEMIMDTGRDLYTPKGVVQGGRRILYLRRTGGFDGYRTTLDLSGGAMSVSRLSPRALDQIAAPDWSPDGSRFAYLASPSRLGDRRETMRVVIQDALSGREFDWPLDGQVHQVSLRWWPDQKSVVVRRAGRQLGSSVVELRDAETGRVLREIPTAGAGGDVVPSPDGSAVIYTARNAVRELRLADLRDRALLEIERPWTLLQASGVSLDRDGDQIAVAVVRRDRALAAARVISRSTGLVRDVSFPVPALLVGWLDTDRLLLAMTGDANDSDRARLLAYDPSTGSTQELGFTAEQPRHFRVHPDGRQVLFSAGQSRLEYWWLENADR